MISTLFMVRLEINQQTSLIVDNFGISYHSIPTEAALKEISSSIIDSVIKIMLILYICNISKSK